jgi:3,2-trans-enoyl-CoA isomerase
MDAKIMKQIRIETDGQTATLTLDRPRANAISVQMVDELLEALDQLEADDELRCLILTGAPGMFCAGLDVPALVALDRAAMTRFWKRFNELCLRLYTSDLMIVTAISGHSPAGGCVLAILTDYRIMQRGRYKIGLNEVAVGIPIPGGLTEVYASLMGLRVAQDLGCRGTMVDPETALRFGLVDELVEGDDLMPAAQRKVAQWVACSRQAQTTTKQLFRRSIASILRDSAQRDRQAFLDLWFSDSAQQILHDLVAKLSAR